MKFKSAIPEIKDALIEIGEAVPLVLPHFNAVQSKYYNLIKYYGGKYYQLENTLPFIRKVAMFNQAETYVECFGGGGKCLLNTDKMSYTFNKKIYNEYDKGICCLFEVASNKKTAKKLVDFLSNQKVNKELFDFCKQHRNDKDNSKFESAYMTFVLCSTSYNGAMGSYVERDEETFYRAVERINYAPEHLANTKIINGDYKVLLQKYGKDKKTVLYLDPPYHPACRNQSALNVYSNELSREQHKEMVNLLCCSRGWVLSGYDPAQYGCDDYVALEESGAIKVSIGKYNILASKNELSKEEFIWYKF